MTKPRLVVVLPTLNGGGAEKVVVDLARALRKDWEIRFLLTNPDSSEDVYAPALAEAGIPVERLPVFRKFATLRKLLPLRRALLRAKPDVVLSAMTQTEAVVSLALRGTGVPHVLSEHNDVADALATRIGHPRIYKTLARLAYRAAETKAAVAVSRHAAEVAERLFAPAFR
ncbi:MAG: glycosyltransferase, partial [Fibrobacterales bacterium]|nr:glycosyltransferase [Fibrobacterales bacterium]